MEYKLPLIKRLEALRSAFFIKRLLLLTNSYKEQLIDIIFVYNHTSFTMKIKKWYVVYTKSRAEKKVHQHLIENGIETFLPLYKTIRQWSDRKKTVEVPLFNSYLFVKISEKESSKVRQTPGFVTFISFNGEKASVPEQEILNLQLIINGKVPIDLTIETFHQGDYVEVDRGPLKDLRGILINYRGKHRVLIRIDIINQNMLIEVPAAFLRKVYRKSA